MAADIEFYFDFVSPYGYLGAVAIERAAARHGRVVDWRPMLLGISVLKVMGLKSVPDTPLKSDYAARDWPRFARLLAVPAAPWTNPRMAPLPAARAFTWLRDRDAALATVLARAIYRAHWGEGRDMSTAEAVAETGASLGVDRGQLIAATQDEGVKRRLRGHVDAALAKGVFGCPTFIVDGEMFWGADRVGQVERWIATGGW